MVIIKHRYTGKVILEGAHLYRANLEGANLEGVDLKEANLKWANLKGANLKGADLRWAEMEGANLYRANLERADLKWAEMEGAEMEGTNLRGAEMEGVNLEGVDLRGTVLWNTAGNRKQIKNINVFDEYPITYTSTSLQIGCENHLIEEWWKFSDKRIVQMDGEEALSFWKKNKDLIRSVIEHSPAI